MSAETAHEIGINALRIGLSSRTAQRIASKQFETEPFDGISRFGLQFKNPLGMAAGFDKNGVVVNQLAALGFGFVEVGTVTLQPQKGNPKPRLFRLPDDAALINRLGFNNDGAEACAQRLAALPPSARRGVLGINVGRNKTTPNEEAESDYIACIDRLQSYADYLVVNISSPNTPGLRALQEKDQLDRLLRGDATRPSDLRRGQVEVPAAGLAACRPEPRDASCACSPAASTRLWLRTE